MKYWTVFKSQLRCLWCRLVTWVHQKNSKTKPFPAHHYPYYFSPIKLNHHPLASADRAHKSWLKAQTYSRELFFNNLVISIFAKKKQSEIYKTPRVKFFLTNWEKISRIKIFAHLDHKNPFCRTQECNEKIWLFCRNIPNLFSIRIEVPLKVLTAHQLHYWNSIFFTLQHLHPPEKARSTKNRSSFFMIDINNKKKWRNAVQCTAETRRENLYFMKREHRKKTV